MTGGHLQHCRDLRRCPVRTRVDIVAGSWDCLRKYIRRLIAAGRTYGDLHSSRGVSLIDDLKRVAALSFHAFGPGSKRLRNTACT